MGLQILKSFSHHRQILKVKNCNAERERSTKNFNDRITQTRQTVRKKVVKVNRKIYITESQYLHSHGQAYFTKMGVINHKKTKSITKHHNTSSPLTLTARQANSTDLKSSQHIIQCSQKHKHRVQTTTYSSFAASSAAGSSAAASSSAAGSSAALFSSFGASSAALSSSFAASSAGASSAGASSAGASSAASSLASSAFSSSFFSGSSSSAGFSGSGSYDFSSSVCFVVNSESTFSSTSLSLMSFLV